MQIIHNVLNILEIVLGIGFLIFVHELGHFLFAKYHHVKVETFSLGFGPRIWGFKRGETDYTIRAIPLGGYVKMAGENPEELRTGAEWELSSKSVFARFQIFVAGTASNFVWAFPIMILAFMIGKESASPVVGDVRPDSPEWESDLQAGDRIVSAGGAPVLAFEDYIKEIVRSPKGERIDVEYERAGLKRKTKVVVGSAKSIGLAPLSTMIAEVEPGRAADGAGLKKGEDIVAIDGLPVFEAGDVASIIDKSSGKELSLSIRGVDGNVRTVVVKPGNGNERWSIGLGNEVSPAVVGTVRPGSPADRAGLKPGDAVMSVAGQPVETFQEMTKIVRARPGKTVGIAWWRGGHLDAADITIGDQGGRGFIGVIPEASAMIAFLLPESPAAKAGLKAGDRILTVDGKEVKILATPSADDLKRAKDDDLFLSLAQVEDYVRRHEAKKIDLGVKRGSESLTISATPEKKAGGDLGIKLTHRTVMLRPGFFPSIGRGCAETMDVFILTFQMLRKLVAAEEEASNLSGPVGIMSASYKSAKEGFGNFLWLLGLISVNLAVINLLPIPILDGGHIFFLLIEKVKGKPVSENVLRGAQWVGLILLLSLVLYVTFHDFKRLFT